MLPFNALPSIALPSIALPSRAVELIREYSKPLTRPDWRTFPRITTKIFMDDILEINKKLYNIICKNKYDYIYSMTKKELINHLHKQDLIIKKLKNETRQPILAKNKTHNIKLQYFLNGTNRHPHYV